MLKKITLLVLILCSSYGFAEPLPADPTRPPVVAQRSVIIDKPAYNLSWLRIGSITKMAVVNGKRVQVGDVVDGAKVLSIAHSGVTLDVGSQEQLISLAEPKGFSKVKSGK